MTNYPITQLPMIHPKHLLDQYGISPKKSLGQNFIFDDFVLAKIAGAADLTPDDHVLEIGPGLGALTRHLAHIAQRVVAVELDGRLTPIFLVQTSDYTNIELIEGDILDLDPADYFQQPYKVVANVPYYITGAILRHLLTAQFKPAIIVLTVQQEVAERLTAVPGDLSLLAVSVQFYGRVEIVEKIKAGAFWPRPDVDSAVIRITLFDERIVPPEEEDAFFSLVKAGFSQKRKQLQKNLRMVGGSTSEIRQKLQSAGIDGTRRAETLSLEEWAAVFTAFK
jgi:16S rRNA (adenine1518-N6/adenine1519-N6)-dimethyltransferase